MPPSMLTAMRATLIATMAATLVTAGRTVPDKPPYTEYAHAARWLVARGAWGVLATGGAVSNQELGEPGVPFANVVSFSDGVYLPDGSWNSTGTPYLFLTELEESTRDIKKNPWASLAISEHMIEACERDPMDPTCWKATLTGKVEPVTCKAERERALRFLFSKHPDMRSWPEGHGFSVYRLTLHKLFLLDFYGGPHHITLDEYFSALPNHHVPTTTAAASSSSSGITTQGVRGSTLA